MTAADETRSSSRARPATGKSSSAWRSMRRSPRKSKLFSGASTAFGGEPNAHVSLVDAAMPGMLPVINEECVEQAVRTGLGLKAQINHALGLRPEELLLSRPAAGLSDQPVQEPDRRRGRGHRRRDGDEQITVGIERLHLEQDAGKSLHDQPPTMSFVDLNRSGVALMEIVSRPDMRSADEARAYVTKLRTILRYLGTCDGDMEKGNLRADVNVSVRRPGEPLGTRCEIKNVNSIRFIGQAIEVEARRQIAIIEDGGNDRPGDAPVRSGPRRDALRWVNADQLAARPTAPYLEGTPDRDSWIRGPTPPSRRWPRGPWPRRRSRSRRPRPRRAGPSATSRHASARPSARPARISSVVARDARPPRRRRAWPDGSRAAARPDGASLRSWRDRRRRAEAARDRGAPCAQLEGRSSQALKATSPAAVMAKRRRRRPSVSRFSVTRPRAASRGGSLYSRVCGNDQKLPSVARTCCSSS